jgi:hypothetical protein
MGGRPQALINSQAVDKADVLVAFFDSRLGSETGVDVSGTAEEIHRAIDQGKPVHVYFSEESISRDADLGQLAALAAFKAELQTKGLLGAYSDPTDLAGQVVRAVEHDIEANSWSNQLPAAATNSAELRWRHDHEKEAKGFDKRGRMTYRTTANRLVVTNSGNVDAADLTFEAVWEGAEPYVGMHLDGGRLPVTVPAHSEMQWLCIPSESGNVRITANWNEGGSPREGSWTVMVRA